ncbi:MAG: hypothetical protein GY801_05885 [bacterium]|nr:hypothetical protein [bacterium]
MLHRYLTVGSLDFSDPRELESVPKGDASHDEPERENPGLRDAVDSFEKQFILRILEQTHWHRGHAAASLKIDPKTLYRKMKQYRLL